MSYGSNFAATDYHYHCSTDTPGKHRIASALKHRTPSIIHRFITLKVPIKPNDPTYLFGTTNFDSVGRVELRKITGDKNKSVAKMARVYLFSE